MKKGIQPHKFKKPHKSQFRQLHGGAIKVETNQKEGIDFII
jgi:hypothetical protein